MKRIQNPMQDLDYLKIYKFRGFLIPNIYMQL